tara:strand:- start:43 stop:270 length:228 start_codon:yes stop_codon:yes gene_type:complete
MAEVLTVPKSEEPSEWRITQAITQEWAKSLDILNVYNEFSIDKTEDYNSAFFQITKYKIYQMACKKIIKPFRPMT